MYKFAPEMRRLLFIFTLAIYGFSAMEAHEWLHVPQVVMHFLEGHTGEEFHDLFHDEHTGGQQHEEHDHNPFKEDCHGEFCAGSGLIALPPLNVAYHISLPPHATSVGVHVLNVALSGFTGNTWIPPKA